MATGNYIRFDWAMKRLLRDKANFDILNGFLSSLLDETITIQNLLESEGNQEEESSKFNRVDLLAQDSRGELIIVEVQNSHEVDYWQRVLYGTAKVINDYIGLGDSYRKIRKVYSVNILYFHVEGSDYVYHGRTGFRGLHTDKELELTANQQKAFGCEKVGDLYPEYYILCVEDFDKVAKTPLDEWISYLKTTTIPPDAKAPGLDAARKKLIFDSLSPEEQLNYRRRIDGMLHEQSCIDEAFGSGEISGMEKGLKEGLSQGRAEGKAEGAKEKSITIATAMKKKGITPDIISELTGLTTTEIEKL